MLSFRYYNYTDISFPFDLIAQDFFVTTTTLLQPAFYEAFGLTVVEAMTCGLPTFATSNGGPAEIIEHGISGFHIDPYHPDQASELLVEFFQTCKTDPSHWKKISDGGLKRIYESYTWKIYSERLLTLAGVYSFWKYVSKLERRETRRYLEMFYILKFRDLVSHMTLFMHDDKLHHCMVMTNIRTIFSGLNRNFQITTELLTCSYISCRD